MPHTAPIAAPLLGWLMGSLIPIEPDHLCSLIALNAGTRKVWPAMVTGMQWGIGHSLGMLLFCALFLPLQSVIKMEVWEHYGNYFAGLLLILVGVYFFVNEKKYLEHQDDGSWAPRADACSCCLAPSSSISLGHGRAHNKGAPHVHGVSCGSECDPESVRAPLLPKETASQSAAEKPPLRKWEVLRSTIIGLLQGMCCPSCMAGLAFVGQLGAQHPTTMDIASFFAIVFCSIVISSALISAGLVMLGNGVNGRLGVSTRSLYWTACYVSVVLGLAWIMLNASGHLHVIEYTTGIEQKIHNLAKSGGSGQAANVSHNISASP